jgi:hypothetical protein
VNPTNGPEFNVSIATLEHLKGVIRVFQLSGLDATNAVVVGWGDDIARLL